MNEGKDGNGVCDGENQMDDKDALQAAAEELIEQMLKGRHRDRSKDETLLDLLLSDKK
jgi:hypothetical protein